MVVNEETIRFPEKQRERDQTEREREREREGYSQNREQQKITLLIINKINRMFTQFSARALPAAKFLIAQLANLTDDAIA